MEVADLIGYSVLIRKWMFRLPTLTSMTVSSKQKVTGCGAGGICTHNSGLSKVNLKM